MEIFMCWHSELMHDISTILSYDYFQKHDIYIFNQPRHTRIRDYLSKDFDWLKMLYNTYGSVAIAPAGYPYGWQFYRARLLRERT